MEVMQTSSETERAARTMTWQTGSESNRTNTQNNRERERQAANNETREAKQTADQRTELKLTVLL